MLYISGIISLSVQLIVALIDFWGLTIVTEEQTIFKDLLKVELGVQIVEFIFYVWMIFNFKNITNITPYRYFDWFLTTPTMLITLCIYLIYLRNEETNIETKDSLIKIVYDNLNTLIPIIFLNFVMLTSGYLEYI